METNQGTSIRKHSISVVFSALIGLLCYWGAYVAILDMTHNVFWATLLAAGACLDLVLALVLAYLPEKEPANIWYTFGAIIFIAAFASTLIWWAIGIQGFSKIVSVGGAGVIFVLRIIVVNIIGGDDHGRLLL